MREGVTGILDSYTLHETIGCGGFGKVKKATHKITGERVAIKILDKVSLGIDLPRVTREIETLKTLNNAFICKLYHVFETTEKIYMTMEYCRGGELFDYIVQRDRLEESEARRIFRQIASAVAYIHARGIAHRDLKPENILLDDDNNVKLIDFGLCAVPSGGLKAELETCCGSPAYAAPELIKGEKYIGPLADVWSLGVLLYALLNGFLPFDDANLGNLYKKIQEGKYFEPRWLSEGSKNILRCMLQVDPNYRLSVEQLLHHTWCQEERPQIPVQILIKDTCNEVLDDDVIRLMCSHFKKHVGAMKAKVLEWDYETQEVATYFMLLARKRKYGLATFRSFGINIDQPMVLFNNKIQKSLEAEFAECDSVDSMPFSTPGRPYFFSMEGGLDDDKLLQIGSPKMEEEKENNVISMEYNQSKIPSPKKQSKFLDSIPHQLSVTGMSPARSADSVLTDAGMKTPQRDKWRGIAGSPCHSATPSRRKVLGSIERGLDKVRLMLTPRTNKTKTKLKNIAYHGKSAFNISVTPHVCPDSLIAELKASLSRIGIDCKQRGYRLLGKVQSQSEHKVLKFELEVVCIDSLNRIGIRRKRQQGDSWQYKKLIETVLNMTVSGNSENKPQDTVKVVEVNQTPVRSKPLMTMV